MICDCKTGYILDVLLYTGKDTELTCDKKFGLSGAIVETLMGPYFDNNRVLFLDNWCTSPDLFEFLFNKTGACGTVRRRKNMPQAPPLENRGDVAYRQANNILAVFWPDKRDVTLLSTIHSTNVVLSQNVNLHTRDQIMKPECVIDYNVNMRLVDKSDAMISSVEFARKTLKWYKKKTIFPPSRPYIAECPCNLHGYIREKM